MECVFNSLAELLRRIIRNDDLARNKTDLVGEELGVSKCISRISGNRKFTRHTIPVFSKEFREVFKIIVIDTIFLFNELFALFLINSGKINNFADKCSSCFGTDRNFRNVEERLTIFFLKVFSVSDANPRRNNQVELSFRNAQPILDAIIFRSKENIDFKTCATENACKFLIITAPILVVIRNFEPKVDKALLAFALIIADELIDNGIHNFFVTEKVIALEACGIHSNNRVTQITIFVHQARDVITNEAAHATSKNNIEVAIKNFKCRFNQLIQSLDTTEHNVVFGRVCTRHVTGTRKNTALETVFKSEECGLLKLATRRAVCYRNSTLDADNRIGRTNCTRKAGVRNRIALFLFNCIKNF